MEGKEDTEASTDTTQQDLTRQRHQRAEGSGGRINAYIARFREAEKEIKEARRTMQECQEWITDQQKVYEDSLTKVATLKKQGLQIVQIPHPILGSVETKTYTNSRAIQEAENQQMLEREKLQAAISQYNTASQDRQKWERMAREEKKAIRAMRGALMQEEQMEEGPNGETPGEDLEKDKTNRKKKRKRIKREIPKRNKRNFFDTLQRKIQKIKEGKLDSSETEIRNPAKPELDDNPENPEKDKGCSADPSEDSDEGSLSES